MALHYILDGYNIIKSTDGLADCKLEEGRKNLVDMIRRERLCGSSRNKVTVIFDGRNDVWGSLRQDAVKTVFTNGGSADDLIRRIVEDEPNAKNLVIVTDDKELASYIGKLNARVMGVNDFLYPSLRRNESARKKGQESSKMISYQSQKKITEELEKIWLKREP
ncbi:MAG: NYN domain-containing protein [Candidatus Omnitrophota bacterium]